MIRIKHPIEIPPEMWQGWQDYRKTSYAHDTPIGLWMIDLDWAKKTFEPIIKKKVTKAWVHFMEKGGFRGDHQHFAPWTGVYYITAPVGSATMILEGEGAIPCNEGEIIMFEKGLHHEVTEHKSDLPRWTIAFEAEDF